MTAKEEKGSVARATHPQEIRWTSQHDICARPGRRRAHRLSGAHPSHSVLPDDGTWPCPQPPDLWQSYRSGMSGRWTWQLFAAPAFHELLRVAVSMATPRPGVFLETSRSGSGGVHAQQSSHTRCVEIRV